MGEMFGMGHELIGFFLILYFEIYRNKAMVELKIPCIWGRTAAKPNGPIVGLGP